MEGLSPRKRGCTIDGKTVHDGAELCSYDICMLCDHGTLEIPPVLSTNTSDQLADPGEAYFVSGYGVVMETKSIPCEGVKER
jgi:hypothetical protein